MLKTNLAGKVMTAAVTCVMSGMFLLGNEFLPSFSSLQLMAAETESQETEVSALPEDPQSVVALSKSVGELWLLAGGQLTGITDDGLEMEGIGEAKSIGSLAKPSMESILALDPDLVLLTSDLPTHIKAAEDLKSQGIPTLQIKISSFADYDSYMKEFTEVTGKADCYEKNVTEVKADIDQVLEDSTVDLAGKNYLEIRVSATKNKVLKNDYFASEIFNDFGLTNIAQDDSSLDDLSVEAILAADPDYIFVIPQGKDDEAQAAYESAFTSDPAWNELSAVKDGQVFVMPKDLFQYKPNARWAEAYSYVNGILSGSGETEAETE